MRRFFIAAFSAGWLLPMWVAGSTYLDYLQAEAALLFRGEHPVNSFPFLSFVSRAFAIGCGWLALVIGGWAWRFAWLPPSPPKSVEPRDPMDSTCRPA
jgi:hypothetical protein